MTQPGLDQRHRDKNGEISRKHGNTEVRTLRKIYGQEFAAGFSESAHLSEVLEKLDAQSLSDLQGHHEDGSIEGRIAKPARFLNIRNPGDLAG